MGASLRGGGRSVRRARVWWKARGGGGGGGEKQAGSRCVMEVHSAGLGGHPKKRHWGSLPGL